MVMATAAMLAAPLVGSGCERQDARAPAVRGEPAPSDFMEQGHLPAWELPDLTGRMESLYVDSSRVTVINFWATWCVPCLREIPELVALNDGWRARAVRLVGVAIASGTAADVQAFATQHGMRYLLLVATEDAGRHYFGRLNLMLALPVTLVVDQAGIIRRRLIGPQTRATFEAAVREAS